jgi:hypothetical protein
MSYKNFTFPKLEQEFGIRQAKKPLFDFDIKSVEPSDWLLETLRISQKLPLRSEKAKSELIIAPIITQIRLLNEDSIEVFSGENLNADSKLKLNGEVDFLFVHYPHSAVLRDPIFNITEAKKGSIQDGLEQCAAQMYGARVFNKNHNNATFNIYGAVSNGIDWQFLFLEGNTIYIDEKTYTTQNLPQLLGVLQYIVDFYK